MIKNYLFFIFILCFVNSYSQDSTTSLVSPFPKNNFKINILSPIVHTLTASYERMISKRWGIEVEGGYIFPLNFDKYTYNPFSPFSKEPHPLLPSTGYLGRIGARYYMYLSEKKGLLLFTGAGIIYKYRYYSNTYFYDWSHRESSYDRAVIQSQENKAYAGELNFGIRYHPGHKHFLMEASMGVDAGSQHRVTDISLFYEGSHAYPANSPHHEETKFYFSINPCIKLGYAF
jgi:hypothetical protein